MANAGFGVVEVPRTTRSGAASALDVAQVIARSAVAMGSGAEILVPGEVAPGRDVDRRRRVGGYDPDRGPVSDAGQRAQQPQEELAAGKVTAVEHERPPTQLRRQSRIRSNLAVRMTLRLWHVGNTSAAVLRVTMRTLLIEGAAV